MHKLRFLALFLLPACGAGSSARQIGVDDDGPDAGDVQSDPDSGPDTQPGDPDAAACVDQVIELVTDGGFDGGLGEWTQESGGGFDMLTGVPGPIGQSQSGPGYAWMGGYDAQQPGTFVRDKLIHQLHVPVGAGPLHVSFYRWISSVEKQTEKVDTMYASIVDDLQVETVIELSNQDQQAVWTQSTGEASWPRSGELVWLHLWSNHSSEKETSFWVDTVSVTTTVCR